MLTTCVSDTPQRAQIVGMPTNAGGAHKCTWLLLFVYFYIFTCVHDLRTLEFSMPQKKKKTTLLWLCRALDFCSPGELKIGT